LAARTQSEVELLIIASGGAAGICFAQRIEATSCTAAIGGNATTNTVSVICGISPGALDALVKARTPPLEELGSSLGESIAL
jgi:hypothetical protein